MKRNRLYVAAAFIVILMTACDSKPNDSTKYSAEITRTKFGIPHIKALDYGSLGYGEALTSSGYNIVHGSSFIMTLNYTEVGPSAEAILSYSQSGSSSSEHFSDQTELYRDKVWRDIYFKPSDILRHKISYQSISE